MKKKNILNALMVLIVVVIAISGVMAVKSLKGPAVLQHDGKTFLVYSASGSWTDDYCLGMLTLTGDDPMNPDHWEKSDKPVFKKRPGVCYGPGHNSFCQAPDGSVWMIYHGNLVSGTGWDGRSIWIAPVIFDEEGYPEFSAPKKEVQFPEVDDMQ